MIFRRMLFALGMVLSTGLVYGSTYKSLVVFGDSYSDNGNTYRVSANTYPTTMRYFQGRFSNGPVWSEYFAQKIGLDPSDYCVFRNYAYGQAQSFGYVTLNTHRLNEAWQFVVPDLKGEIAEYLRQGNEDIQNTLFVIYIGTNDILNREDIMHIDSKRAIFDMVAPQEEAVNTLQDLGARHIILLLARDLAQTPLAKQQAKKYAEKHDQVTEKAYLTRLNQFIQEYNQYLKERFKNSSHVFLFDTYAFDKEALKKDPKTACYVNEGNYVDPMGPGCRNPNAHFYYDRVHLGREASQKMAQAVYQKFVEK